MHFSSQKIAKILFVIFIMVLSAVVLSRVVLESKYVTSTIKQLEDNETMVMAFSGSTIATSLALSTLPDDFASPLADTVADLLTYFRNLIKRFISSISILLITNFVLPIINLFVFKWILKELFSITIPVPKALTRLPRKPKFQKEDDDDEESQERS